MEKNLNQNVIEAKARAAEAHADLSDEDRAALYEGAEARMVNYLNDNYRRARLAGNRDEQIAALAKAAAR